MRSIPFLVLAAFSSPALADEVERPVPILEADGPWLLDYSDERCRAARKFKPLDGSEPTLFYIEQYEPGAHFDWLLAGGGVPDDSTWKARFGPRYNAFDIDGPKATFGDYGEAIRGRASLSWDILVDDADAEAMKKLPKREVGRPRLPIERAEGVEWFEISSDSSDAVRLPLGNFSSLHSAMSACMTDLIESWGIDAEAQTRLVTKPILLNYSELAEAVVEHYPDKALDKAKSAFFDARIMVEADGTVSKCSLMAKTIADDFDGYACRKVVEVARFKPALDAEGKPMRWFYFQNISYRMK